MTNNSPIPRLLVGGVSSGVGKTSITLGIIAALRRRGLRVQTFKVGPDYLDPTWLRLASGRQAYNLDGWMTGREYVQQLFADKTRDCDIAVIEGVMGLFDGASVNSLEGSSAEVASWLQAEVLLVCDTGGMAGSVAALVKGFNDYSDSCTIRGVIANRCGSAAHAKLLRQALEQAGQPPLVGWIGKGALPTMPSRHLGLVTAAEAGAQGLVDQLADACEQTIDLDALLKTTRNSSPAHATPRGPATNAATDKPLRLGIAQDQAFSFYYPDNLEMLEARGVTLVPFSPLQDSRLPPELDGLYLGGGYPEIHAQQLSGNREMIAAVGAFIDSDRPVYAECGGLVYLSRFIETLDGDSYPLVGALPFGCRMRSSLKRLGYRRTRLTAACLLGPVGTELRGHEFHYSEVCQSAERDCQRVYQLQGRAGRPAQPEGYRQGNLLASYVHQHFGATPKALDAWIEALQDAANKRIADRSATRPSGTSKSTTDKTTAKHSAIAAEPY